MQDSGKLLNWEVVVYAHIGIADCIFYIQLNYFFFHCAIPRFSSSVTQSPIQYKLIYLPKWLLHASITSPLIGGLIHTIVLNSKFSPHSSFAFPICADISYCPALLYSVRGLERSELGGSHGCPGLLWDRFLWQVYTPSKASCLLSFW